jgi:hypothetical protein
MISAGSGSSSDRSRAGVVFSAASLLLLTLALLALRLAGIGSGWQVPAADDRTRRRVTARPARACPAVLSS